MRSQIVLILFFTVFVSGFEDPSTKQRAKFNYSSRPSPTLYQGPIRDRVPDAFALIDENDEEPTTKAPVELSFGYQFGAVSSGFDKKSEGSSSKPVKPSTTVTAEDEEDSSEDNDNGRLLRSSSRKEPVVVPVEDDEEPSTTPVVRPPPPIGYEFFHVSSQLNEPKKVEATPDQEAEVDKKKKEASKVEENSEEDAEEEDDNSEEKKDKDEVEPVVVPTDPNAKPSRLGRQNRFSNLRKNYKLLNY